MEKRRVERGVATSSWAREGESCVMDDISHNEERLMALGMCTLIG